MTELEIRSKMTRNGGFTKKQLYEWGVPWPPPKGWKNLLLAGLRMPPVLSHTKQQQAIEFEKDRRLNAEKQKKLQRYRMRTLGNSSMSGAVVFVPKNSLQASGQRVK